jgi:adenylate kinase
MRLVLLGPPGAGKGTQAVVLAEEWEIPHISTGDMFRQAVKDETTMGKKAKEYMDKGLLVPDEVVVGLVEERLGRSDAAEGFILDGFPRTIAQADALAGIIHSMGYILDAVINIVVPEDLLVKRLAGRRVCRNCGATYHVEFNPPKEEGKCDKCGGELYQRDDDQEETVRKRLKEYDEKTSPLIAYYAGKGILRNIDGSESADIVLNSIRKSLGR